MKTKFIRFKVRLVSKLNKLKVFFAIRGNRKIASKFTEQSKALPCPFCGNETIFTKVDDNSVQWFLWCEKCHTFGPCGHGGVSALQAWNTRVKPKLR